MSVDVVPTVETGASTRSKPASLQDKFNVRDWRNRPTKYSLARAAVAAIRLNLPDTCGDKVGLASAATPKIAATAPRFLADAPIAHGPLPAITNAWKMLRMKGSL